MNCQDARERVQDKYDGMLPAADAKRLDQHLNSCESCRAYDAQMADLVAGLAELRAATVLPPAPLSQDTPSTRPSFVHRLTRVSQLAAAIALLVIAGLLVRSFVGRLDHSDVAPRGSGDPVVIAAFKPVVHLGPASAERFIPVVQSTDDPHVHLIWLHATLPKPDDDPTDSSSSILNEGISPTLTTTYGASPGFTATGGPTPEATDPSHDASDPPLVS